MIRTSQSIKQSQVLQQRLSPQQIQYIKLLQLPTLLLEQRVKQELETNPVLELDEDTDRADEAELEDTSYEEDYSGDESKEEDKTEELTSLDDEKEIDWDSYFNDDEDIYVPSYNKEQEEWRDLPKPYKTSFIEKLERQVDLLRLDERQQKIADQIIGSIDSDGYLRRDLDAIIDAVAFNDGVLVTYTEAERVLFQIQRLEPAGIAARDLRECLLVQLDAMGSNHPSHALAIEILEKAWPLFEKKHYDKIRKKLNVSEIQLREANQIILLLDPKPGESDEYLNPDQFIIPDFEVYFEEEIEDSDEEKGSFVIRMNSRNMPNIKISRHYKEMWDAVSKQKKKKGSKGGDDMFSGNRAGSHTDKESRETRQFIREKMESARWFIESIQQRRNTLMSVMQTITALQEEFFRTGKNLRPMILKDVAERIQMDISTVSRVVNGKYVQTPFGVFELKYFFTEGLETDTGESISNREIKNILLELISKEDKRKPLSDQALAEELEKRGFSIARRTISKYREQLQIPVARLRKDLA
ncbi:RNA polymerase factor sigma-54 [Balneolaceae bacterium ANBcel3]|nr:RNA polymerase factor sigma-54 [Balneolaceae bacterium ANBcel3]